MGLGREQNFSFNNLKTKSVMDAKYNCSQDELYVAILLVLMSFEEELAKFTGAKPKYTAAYAGTYRLEIAAARAIPDVTQRSANNEVRREELVVRVKNEDSSTTEIAEVEEKLGLFRLYIVDVWKNKVMQRARLSEAGFDMYDKVMRYNWEKLVEVMEKGKDFLLNHEAEMLLDGVMPVTFKADFDAMADSIISAVTFYLNENQNIVQVTQAKIMANNAIYVKGMEICKVGQELFKRDPAKKTQFIWQDVLNIVTPPGAAGLRGTVKVSGSNYAVVGATIEMQTEGGTPVTFVTDAEGMYYSGNLPVGWYTFKLSKDGFATIETEVEIKTGVTSYKHWLMNAGGGTIVVVEGALGLNQIANVALAAGVNDDTTVTLEALGTQMKYYAADAVNGEQTGSGALYANMGVPVTMKWNQVVAQIGLDGVHGFFNVKNVGSASGSWRVTFVIP